MTVVKSNHEEVCECISCTAMRKAGYVDKDAWAARILTPINDFMHRHAKGMVDEINAKRVEGTMTPEEAVETKGLLFSNIMHQLVHLSSGLAHVTGTGVSSFVGAAADHWLLSQPASTQMGSFIPPELLELFVENLEEGSSPFDESTGKPSKEEPN